MNELTKAFFSTEDGKNVYSNFLSAIDEFSMADLISDGVLVGLSGGADSVALLLLLIEYRRTHDFNLKAVHINHMIRGAEANFDEDFSRDICKKLGVDFLSYKIDVPAIAKAQGIGLEEAARNARYEKFGEIINSDPDISVIAVAHNATDNLETVLFNMMRGSGIVGISGIRPVRDNIIRPLIYSSKELICKALTNAKIGFVVDSTNLSSEYTRNYIRNEILPKLRKISDSPERMCTRCTATLREDSDFLLSLAEKFIADNMKDGKIPASALFSLEKPLLSRVLMLMCKKKALPAPEKVHIDSVCSMIKNDRFSISLPGGVDFIVREGIAYIGKTESENIEFSYPLSEGMNKIPGYDTIILVSKDKNYDCFLNIYKKSIQVKIKSDIINAGLYVRSRRDGDSYRFGNMTRKLKKILNDRGVLPSKRKDIPIFCDSCGILWVPGFSVRDGAANGEDWYITLLDPISADAKTQCFVIADN